MHHKIIYYPPNGFLFLYETCQDFVDSSGLGEAEQWCGGCVDDALLLRRRCLEVVVDDSGCGRKEKEGNEDGRPGGQSGIYELPELTHCRIDAPIWDRRT